ncbi:MAG: tRNA pseudouridine(38-40) synthase TruA [Clostridia bacterium]|nr:tRNA pseudouridine(38-40) synthase TruA [Clostridia bacterium]
MKRILLTIEYDGTNYSGWQKQPCQKTIQGEIEGAIFRAIGKEVEIFGSGRTDAGVHALHQTAHFDLDLPVPTSKIPDILNNALPADIVIKGAEEVVPDFHARFSIKRKCYLYQIYNSQIKQAFLANRMAWVRKLLDVKRMKECAKILIGEHDFRGLCSANTCATDFVRKIFAINIKKDGEYLSVSVQGSGFLYNMVRIIVGTLVDYALEKITLNDVKDALKNGDRSKAGQTMPACGLYLQDTIY